MAKIYENQSKRNNVFKRGRILRSSNSTNSSSQFKSELPLDICLETIRQPIHDSQKIVRAKMNMAPNLKPIHKENSMKFVQENLARDWNQVV